MNPKKTKNPPRLWYERRTAAKTVITDEEKPFSASILYTFRNDAGGMQRVEAHNYRAARRALDRQTSGARGYRLVERRL